MDFLLQKQGRTWDSIPFPNVDIKELENLDLFRKYAANSKRIDQQSLEQDDKSLIEKLRLFSDGYLKRAAILLFHENPEKYIGGAFIKIGFFENDSDLLYQDEVHGNLFTQAEKTIDLLMTKYLMFIRIIAKTPQFKFLFMKIN